MDDGRDPMDEDGMMEEGGKALESPLEYMDGAMDGGHEVHMALANGGVFMTDRTGGVSVHAGMSSERAKTLRRMVADQIRQWGLQGKWCRMDGSELYPEDNRGE